MLGLTHNVMAEWLRTNSQSYLIGREILGTYKHIVSIQVACRQQRHHISQHYTQKTTLHCSISPVSLGSVLIPPSGVHHHRCTLSHFLTLLLYCNIVQLLNSRRSSRCYWSTVTGLFHCQNICIYFCLCDL